MHFQSNTPDVHWEPLNMTELPGGPWRKVSVDLCRPLANRYLALLFHCQYTRYPVAEFLIPTSKKSTIPECRRVFDTNGQLEVVKLAWAICWAHNVLIPTENSVCLGQTFFVNLLASVLSLVSLSLRTGTLRCHPQRTDCKGLHSLYASILSWRGVSSNSYNSCIEVP